MSRSLSASVLISSAGAIVNALSGLVTAAFLLRQLGLDAFGMWSLIVSTTSLLWMLDLGATVAIGRLIAGERAREDIDGVNRIFSTGVALLAACAIVVGLAASLVPGAFFAAFSVAGEARADVGFALWLMAVAVSMHFLTAPFTCLLWGYERLDMINLIDVPLVVLRLGLLLLFVSSGSPIWVVGACTLFTQALGVLLHAAMCLRVEPKLAVRPSLVNLQDARSVVRLGLDFAALNIARSVALQVSPLIVGYALSNAAVGLFAIARQLSTNCNTLVSAATEAIAARSVRLFHEGLTSDQQNLFVQGGRYTAILSGFLAFGLISFGDTFIYLWQGGRAEGAYDQLRILMLGELVAMSQWVTFWILAGIRKQRILSFYAVCESLGIVALSFVLIPRFDLTGVSIAAALAAVVFRGLGPSLYGCRLLGVRFADYAQRVMLPAILCCVAGGLAGYVLDTLLAPEHWISFLIAASVYAIAFGTAAASLLGLNPLKSLSGRKSHP